MPVHNCDLKNSPLHSKNFLLKLKNKLKDIEKSFLKCKTILAILRSRCFPPNQSIFHPLPINLPKFYGFNNHEESWMQILFPQYVFGYKYLIRGSDCRKDLWLISPPWDLGTCSPTYHSLTFPLHPFLLLLFRLFNYPCLCRLIVCYNCWQINFTNSIKNPYILS